MPTMIYVDGKKYNVNCKDNLLHACLSVGLDIPYFCWHPALGSVGACRQCAVKYYQDSTDSSGRLVMSCMTPVINGALISICDKSAQEFRKSIIELLMINHPHDCPICAEAGHCHLQDMTVMNGHTLRRYRFNKRTHHNQNLGLFISHEMNRCIACYRCVRYYKDYADGKDFGVYGASENIYFGRIEDGALENELSGNLIEICPTGVFTDKTHSGRYNRKWDMQFSPGICHQCSLGCNIILGERYGELRRIENRYNGMVNHYFLCDRGRFGYGYVNLQDRPKYPMYRQGSEWIQLNSGQALKCAADIIRKAKRVIGIGSSRASIESNFSLLSLVGENNFSTGFLSSEQICIDLVLQILRDSGIHTPTLREIESYDAILVLGEDITQVAARMALAVRQATKGRARDLAKKQKIADWHSAAIMNSSVDVRYPLFLTSVDRTRLDDIATWSYYASVEDQARFGFAIANRIDNSAPGVTDLSESLCNQIDIIVNTLCNAKKPLIISGTHSGSPAIIQAAANIAKALKGCVEEVGLSFLTQTVNSIGLGLIGGFSLDVALKELSNGEADTVIILEKDLYRDISQNIINHSLNYTKQIILLDHQHTKTSQHANIIFSSASFAESDGTVINQECRAQRFFQAYDPSYYDENVEILASWRWLDALKQTVNNCFVDWNQLDNVINSCIRVLPILSGIKKAAPSANFRVYGQKLARSPHRYSGRTAIRSNISVHEPRQPQDLDSMFNFSMEGYQEPCSNHSQIPFVWAPGWNSPQAWNKFQNTIGEALRGGDPGERLMEVHDKTLHWFTNIPNAFKAKAKRWRIVPYFHLFGSEEMTQRSDVIKKCMPEPYLMMNLQDAEKLGIHEGSSIECQCCGEDFFLPVFFSPNLQSGQIGMPIGFPGLFLSLCGEDLCNLRQVKK
ncbi:NADH-quinone oxidoreductase subunit G [Candidatus Erwinia haradaeae]|uniref:NADH-quinone oxidoreductase subunit G n=2 Tax=Candidatus Erwinia haradaeae TaxID=1922217 RepID=A0A451D1M9_9GAMM|nr:NADH-quinone oxidoreductase subunit NuoG [Candidatus Erwinia haradaeae]VFP79512.1 NADH-quinone oxidoreductase subunit G [Candidatus Erwinia haradaeae]